MYITDSVPLASAQSAPAEVNVGAPAALRSCDLPAGAAARGRAARHRRSGESYERPHRQPAAEDRTTAQTIKENTMSLGMIILIILVIALLGGFSGFGGGYGYGYGHGGVGVIGVILIIVLVLVLLGRI
jgi:hypothetical protein